MRIPGNDIFSVIFQIFVFTEGFKISKIADIDNAVLHFGNPAVAAFKVMKFDQIIFKSPVIMRYYGEPWRFFDNEVTRQLYIDIRSFPKSADDCFRLVLLITACLNVKYSAVTGDIINSFMNNFASA